MYEFMLSHLILTACSLAAKTALVRFHIGMNTHVHFQLSFAVASPAANFTAERFLPGVSALVYFSGGLAAKLSVAELAIEIFDLVVHYLHVNLQRSVVHESVSTNMTGELVLYVIRPMFEFVMPHSFNIFESFVTLVAFEWSGLLMYHHVFPEVLGMVVLVTDGTAGGVDSVFGLVMDKGGRSIVAFLTERTHVQAVIIFALWMLLGNVYSQLRAAG